MEEKPNGNHMVFNFQSFTIDILRNDDDEDNIDDGDDDRAVHSGHNGHHGSTSSEYNKLLETAFSLQITNIKADLETHGLLTATVLLESVEIVDIREISSDYSIKKILSPQTAHTKMAEHVAYMNRQSIVGTHLGRDNVSTTRSSLIQRSESGNLGSTTSLHGLDTMDGNDDVKDDVSNGNDDTNDANADEAENIIEVVFRQESPKQSYIDVLVNDASSFASTDTFLDLSSIAMANFSTFLELLAAPSSSAELERYRGNVGSSTTSPSTLSRNTSISSGIGDGIDRPASSTPGRVGQSSTMDRSEDSEDVDGGMFRDSVPDLARVDTTSAIDAYHSDSTMTSRADDSTAFSQSNNKDNTEGGDYSDGNRNRVGSRDSDAPRRREPLYQVENSMIVKVVLKDPRLHLLDDPTLESTAAIVGRCGVEVHYTRDQALSGYSVEGSMFELQRKMVRESLHVSVKSLEIFTLADLQQYVPHAIIEPFGVEVNMRREVVDKELVCSSLSVDTDAVKARVTMNDLLLANSVIFRSSTTDNSASENKKVTPKKASEKPSPATPMPAVPAVPKRSGTAHTFSFNLGQIALIAINDFEGKNVPILRMSLDETKLCLAKGENLLIGDGDLYLSADFYNPKLNIWEPILDPSHPQMQICTTEETGIEFNVQSEDTMQITVSGIMLETLMNSHALFMMSSFAEDSLSREMVSEIMIKNNLGNDLDVLINDAASESHLMHLCAGEEVNLPRVQEGGKMNVSNGVLPYALDVCFTGTFSEQRLNLKGLPLHINKCVLYHLLPKGDDSLPGPGTPGAGGLKEGDSTTASPSSLSPAPRQAPSRSVASLVGTRTQPEHSQMVVIEPIEEETYQYARFDPLTGKWRKPFLVGDPHEWSDAQGIAERKIDSVTGSISERWEWQGSWTVCMRGKVGEEIDEEGWEYSTSFNNFSVANVRHNYKSLDSCRRRRWINSRVPSTAHLAEKHRPLNIIWDVTVQKNGVKVAQLRSAMQVKNDMPFAIEIILNYSAWDEDVTLGPIKEGELYSVPLLYSYATSMMMRPADIPYSWSDSISCAIRVFDFSSSADLICRGEAGDDDIAPVCMRALIDQKDKSITIRCISYIVINNRMPCDVRYRISSRDNKSEEGEVYAGAQSKLAYLNWMYNPRLSLSLGDSSLWSTAVVVDCTKRSDKNIDISKRVIHHVELPHARQTIPGSSDSGIVICVSVIRDLDFNVEVNIYNRYLLVDYTDLNLSISSYKDNGEAMLRHTWTMADSDLPTNRRKTVRSSVKITDATSTIQGNEKEDGNASEGDGSSMAGRGTVWRDSISGSDVTEKEKDVAAIYDGMIQDFSVDSKHLYEFNTVEAGDYVYSDRKFTWTYLPEALLNHLYIRTPCNDKLRRSRSMMRFHVKKDTYIIVLRDSRGNKNKGMRWLKDDGFQDLVGHAIARRILRGSLQEVYFTLHGKFFQAGSLVSLGGNYSKEITAMYTVFCISDDSQTSAHLSILSQIQFNHKYQRSLANRCWQDGGEGVSLFFSGDDTIQIGVKKCSAWSEELRISMTNVSHKHNFEVLDHKTKHAYQLSYRMRYMPGVFDRTQEVCVFNRYCVVNLMEEDIMLLQVGNHCYSSLLLLSYYDAF